MIRRARAAALRVAALRAAALPVVLAVLAGAGAAQQDGIAITPLDPADDGIALRPLAPQQQDERPAVPGEDPRPVGASGRGAILRGLDKVNGHVQDFALATGQTARIFGLDVALGECRYPADNPTGDAFAYLTIWEAGRNDQLFDGWMVASSPALNALDHRRYDVWVLRCITSAAEGSGGAEKSAG